MKSTLTQTQLQQKIHSRQLNFTKADYFGRLVSGYLVRKYRRYISSPILDAGAGEGSLIRALRKIFPADQILGVDLVPVPELNITVGDLKHLAYPAASFATVCCMEVLEHLDDITLNRTLKEFDRILKPGGHLICTFPYDEDLTRLTMTCPHCDHSFHKYGHVRSWHTQEAIKQTFSKVNLQIVSLQIMPLGAIAKMPFLIIFKPLLNRLNNPPGFKKRAVVVLRKSEN